MDAFSTFALGAVGAKGLRMGACHQKNLVGYMYKCAVFDIKSTNTCRLIVKFFIPGVHLHSPKISVGGSGVTPQSHAP